MQHDTKVILGIGLFTLAIFAVGTFLYMQNQGSTPADQPTELTASQEERLVRSNSPILGDPDAPVTVVEFADLQCPACRAVQPMVEQILEEYEGDVRVVYRHFPLHNHSVLAGTFAAAAREQGQFGEFTDVLFENQREWARSGNPRELFIGYAREIGLDIEELRADLESHDYEAKIARDRQDAIALGVRATPTFFVEGQKISGVPSFAQLSSLIEAELAAEDTNNNDSEATQTQPSDATTTSAQ